MKLLVAIAVGVLGVATAHAKDAPSRCIDGTMSIFIEGAVVPANQLSEKRPSVHYEGDSIAFEDAKARGKIVWEALPAGARVRSEQIADYRGHAIFRATYEWEEDGETNRCILLAYSETGIASVRPFFIAGGEELSDLEALITSTEKVPFGLEARVSWKGNGVMTAYFAYRFEPTGPRLYSRTNSGRGEEGKTRRF